MSQEINHPLNHEYDHWHEVICLRYNHFLQAITALELEDAERHLKIFSNLLRNILDFSDHHLSKLIDDSDHAFELLKADHLILTKTLVMVEDGLAELKNVEREQRKKLRSALVDRLDLLVRLNNILNKHQIRQVELMFPLIEQIVQGEKAHSLTKEMTEVMQRALPN